MSQRRDGIVVACTPFIADPAELVFETRNFDGQRRYRIGPRDRSQTRRRVGAVVRRLDAVGAQVALVSEFSLTSRLLREWSTTLASRTPPAGSQLRWVIVGTGHVGPAHGRRHNRAVALNGRTGELLFSHDKTEPSTLDEAALAAWKLDRRLGRERIVEGIVPGERVTIVDAPGVRLAVVIGEELASSPGLRECICDFGVTHILLPSFSAAAREGSGSHQAAVIEHSRSTGSTIVVSGGMVLERLRGDGTGPTSRVAWRDGIVAARVDHPADVVAFRIACDGAAEHLGKRMIPGLGGA